MTGLYISFAFFLMGIFAPCIKITPGAGGLEWCVKIFNPSSMEPKNISILGSINKLLLNGDLLIGFIILAFSILFPLYKYYILMKAIESKNSDDLALIDKLGKYSMLDVFVLAMFVVIIKVMPGGTTVSLEFGTYAFAASIAIFKICLYDVKKNSHTAS